MARIAINPEDASALIDSQLADIEAGINCVASQFPPLALQQHENVYGALEVDIGKRARSGGRAGQHS